VENKYNLKSIVDQAYSTITLQLVQALRNIVSLSNFCLLDMFLMSFSSLKVLCYGENIVIF